MKPHPDECAYANQQCLVAGIDEAGRGCWAGDVFAACVVIPPSLLLQPEPWIFELNDSKKLSHLQRATLYNHLIENCAVGVGVGTIEEIEHLNIRQATFLAMQRAAARIHADYYLIDGRDIPKPFDVNNTRAIIGGDAAYICIAAASIVAKYKRDMQMQAADADYPQYGFGQHKGYGTAQHRRALQEHGVCVLHRLAFQPMAMYANAGDVA